MNRYYVRHSGGNVYEVRLYALAEYEADGGRYDDSGNGGEAVNKEDFVCAAVVCEMGRGLTGELEAGDRLSRPDAAGILELDPRDLWEDSTTGYLLLRTWPVNVPLAARLVGGS